MVRRRWRAWVLATALLLALTVLGCKAAQYAGVLRAQLQSRSTRYVSEGDRLAAQGRAAEGILAYRQAVTQDTQNPQALRKLARAYASQGRSRLAGRYLQRALALQPGDPGLSRELATLSTPTPQLQPLWQTAVGEEMPTGIALKDGVLYVVLENGQVQALTAATGKHLWDARLPAKATSAPTVAGDLLLIGGEDGALRALAAKDGHQLWEFAAKAPIYAASAATADSAYCPSGDGTLYALGLVDGAQRWVLATTGPLTGKPAVADGVLYFGDAGGRIHAVDAGTGTELWGAGVMARGAVESQPVVADGRVFVGAGDSRLYALAVASGGEYWHYSTLDAIYAAPVVVRDTVYIASGGGTVAAIETLSGATRWESRASNAITFPMAVDGGILYFVASGAPNLFALDAATGDPLWQLDTGDWLASGPLIADGALYLAGKDGTILAYRVAG